VSPFYKNGMCPHSKNDEEYSAGTAISVGAQEFIRKPFSLSEFVIRLRKMISDSETLKGAKSEKKEDEDIQDLMNEVDTHGQARGTLK
jgi:DNA-binding response OmpR family regulator